MQSRCRSHFYVRGPILLFYFERRLEPPLQNLLSRYFGWCIHIMNSSLDFKTAFFAVIFKTMSLYETATLTAECTRFLVVHHVICDRTLRSFAHSFDRPLHGDPAQAYKKKQKKTKQRQKLHFASPNQHPLYPLRKQLLSRYVASPDLPSVRTLQLSTTTWQANKTPNEQSFLHCAVVTPRHVQDNPLQKSIYENEFGSTTSSISVARLRTLNFQNHE